MLKLEKRFAVLDETQPNGWAPMTGGIKVNFKAGPDIFISTEMFEYLRDTFEFAYKQHPEMKKG